MTDLSTVLQDAHAYYRDPRRVATSWVPDHLNRRNLYPQLRPAGLGYAPPGWTALTDHLRGRGHTDAEVKAAGLARTSSVGHLVDLFRDRLMVPVTDDRRTLVGFIGRAHSDAAASVPRWLNSPTTALFDKGRLLYALGEDRAALAAGAMPVLVEGPMDRLALRQAAGSLAVVGVAPCGTALTLTQVEQIVAVVGTRRPIAVALDADPAGQAATARAWEVLTRAGLTNLLHVRLPPGKDPADLVRAGHGPQLRRAILHSRPLAHAVADHVINQAGTMDHLGRRIAVLNHLLDRDLTHVTLDQIGPYLAHLSRRLEIDHQDVTAAAAERLSPTPPDRPPGEATEALHAATQGAQGFPHGFADTGRADPDRAGHNSSRPHLQHGTEMA